MESFDNSQQQFDSCLENYGNIKPIYFHSKIIAYIGPGFYQFLGSLAFSTLLMIIAQYFTQCSLVFKIIGITSKILLFFCLLAVAIVNPGIQVINYQLAPPVGRFCGTCKIQGRRGTRHCRDCNTCISQYDHHCPYFGTCIGKGNIVYFRLTMALLGINMILLVLANVLGKQDTSSSLILN